MNNIFLKKITNNKKEVLWNIYIAALNLTPYLTYSKTL